MKPNGIPFNVTILEPTPDKLQALRPVRSLAVYEGAGGNFHEDGLFSVSTFGRVGDDARDQRFSFIDIKTSILHPLVHRSLIRLKALYGEILTGRGYATWDATLKDFVPANELVGSTGFSFFMSHYPELQLRESKSAVRTQRVGLIRKYQKSAALSKILVIPAGLRDFEVDAQGRQSQDEINDIYRKVLSASNTVADTDSKNTSPVLDNSRRLLQERFNEIYDTLERMITGKKGFFQNKYGSRRVFNGTRNVISAMNTSSTYLGGPTSPRITDTILGLFQVAKGALPVTVGLLRGGFLSEVFSVGTSSTQAKLVNPKTLRGEIVDLPLKTRDRWITVEGLERVVESYRVVANRHSPIVIDGYYLGLMYKGPDGTFRMFHDIQDLPEHLDRKHVEPISLVQLLYLAGYQRWNTLKAIVTRYPVAGLGSTYPSTVYCKTSIIGEVRRELGQDWQPLDATHTALEFPTKEPLAFVDSQVLHSSRLAGLAADFDGDTASATFVYSDEAIAEIDQHFKSKEAYLDPRGGFKASTDVDTVAWVLRNMTGD